MKLFFRCVRRLIVVFVVSGLVSVLGGCASAHFIILPDAPGGDTEAFAYAISDDGHAVVGESRTQASARAQHGEGVRWSKTKKSALRPGATASWDVETLGFLPGPDKYSPAFGVSEHGQIVVGVGHQDIGLANDSAYEWSNYTGPFALGRLSGDTFSVANAVSGSGSLAVGSSGPAFFPDYRDQKAVIWSRVSSAFGPPELIDELPGAPTESRAMDVVSDPYVVPPRTGIIKIVGWAANPAGTLVPGYGAVRHNAVCWYFEGGTAVQRTLLSNPAGLLVNYSRAMASSRFGSIIVGARAAAPIPGDPSMLQGVLFQPVLWRTSTTSCNEVAEQEIPMLPGSNSCIAEDVSKDGSTVVGSCSFLSVDASGNLSVENSGSFVFNVASGQTRSIAMLLTSYGETAHNGWTLYQATGVSQDGQWACGNAFNNTTGELAAWVAHLRGRPRFGVPSIPPSTPAKPPIDLWDRVVARVRG